MNKSALYNVKNEPRPTQTLKIFKSKEVFALELNHFLQVQENRRQCVEGYSCTTRKRFRQNRHVFSGIDAESEEKSCWQTEARYLKVRTAPMPPSTETI